MEISFSYNYEKKRLKVLKNGILVQLVVGNSAIKQFRKITRWKDSKN